MAGKSEGISDAFVIWQCLASASGAKVALMPFTCSVSEYQARPPLRLYHLLVLFSHAILNSGLRLWPLFSLSGDDTRMVVTLGLTSDFVVPSEV